MQNPDLLLPKLIGRVRVGNQTLEMFTRYFNVVDFLFVFKGINKKIRMRIFYIILLLETAARCCHVTVIIDTESSNGRR